MVCFHNGFKSNLYKIMKKSQNKYATKTAGETRTIGKNNDVYYSIEYYIL